MWRRWFSNYLVAIGALANGALLLLIAYWLYGQVGASGVISDVRRAFSGSLDGVAVTALRPAAPGTHNADLLRLPPGEWTKIHQQSDGDAAAFRRQAHGGAAFDARRGRLMLFGSDTHREDWDNTVRFFDVAALRWSQAYAADDPQTYRVNADGLAVAGSAGERPWAMHTFDAVEYDPQADRLIVSSYPQHMAPDKSWGMDAALWKQIRRHPTWLYSIADNRWQALPGKAPMFFPYATTFDPNRNAVIGANPDGFWELSGTPATWRRIARGTPQAWHTAAAYDADRDTVVMFGTNKRANAVWQYRRGDEAGSKMPTPGQRPPGGESVPLVYHAGLRQVIALVTNRQTKTTETWLYATAADAWTRVESARLPFNIGMNYQAAYDPRHDLVLLVASLPGDPVAVWALRLAH